MKIEKRNIFEILEYLDKNKIEYSKYKRPHKYLYEIENDNYYDNIELDYNNCYEYAFLCDYGLDNDIELFIDIYECKDFNLSLKNYDYYVVDIDIDNRYSFEYVIKSSGLYNLNMLLKGANK